MTTRRSGRPAGRAGDGAEGGDALATLRLVTDAHVRGMAEHLMEALAPRGVVPHHVEGLTQGRWVLLDYVDFVVHVFHPELREFYQLERLWSDAPVVVAGNAGGSGAKG